MLLILVIPVILLLILDLLLYNVLLTITVLLKGSLLSCWVIYKYKTLLQRLILVFAGILLQIYMIREDLQITTYHSVVLVLLSTITGICIFISHRAWQEEERSNVIGIFSWSSVDEYNWLSAALKTAGKVVPFCITKSNFREFRDQVSKCSFAILYHSKTRGRINITDITESLYDEEVKHMSQVLGRENVLVVVDNLDDGSDWVKNNILQSQTTIRDQTRDLYLFTREEKRDKERIKEKLQPILNSLTQESSKRLLADWIGALILCAPCLHYCIDVDHIWAVILLVPWLHYCFHIFHIRALIPRVPWLQYCIDVYHIWAVILFVPWLHYCFHIYHFSVLLISNIGSSLLLLMFLLPLNLGYSQKRLFVLLLVAAVLELLAVHWLYSGEKAVLLAVPSVFTMLYAVLSSSSTAFRVNHHQKKNDVTSN
ncbi:uncharacterized protein [Aquarana catesbeiana]|uniref:uncharacterized protein n=1 Tax=Aquarana catesbeiana TaxID=8400 RepID=UPI003CC99819